MAEPPACRSPTLLVGGRGYLPMRRLLACTSAAALAGRAHHGVGDCPVSGIGGVRVALRADERERAEPGLSLPGRVEDGEHPRDTGVGLRRRSCDRRLERGVDRLQAHELTRIRIPR